MTKDIEEVLDTLFASMSPGKTNLWESRVPKTRREVWSKEGLPSVKGEQVREHLKKLSILRCMGLDRVHPQVQGKLVSVFDRPLLKRTKEKDVAGNSQHGFVKGKSSLTNLINFCVEMTSSVDEGEQ